MASPQPPPGMVAMLHQAYPGGPQQIYYVPAPGKQAGGAGGVMEGLESKIRALASTDKLEGFSFKEVFKETFRKHGSDAVEEYMAAGSARTTPPLELVDTNWPKPWMFFRVVAGLAIAYGVFYAEFIYTQNINLVLGIMVLATFAVPMATVTLLWEMNAPRNISVAKTIEVCVLGGGLSIVIATLWYMIPPFNAPQDVAGIVEETSKLLAVIIVTYSARGARYPYQLNGILFGAAVGAGFACSETLGYGLQAGMRFFEGGGVQQLLAANPQLTVGQLFVSVIKSIVPNLDMRGLESPFGHPMMTAISAGAFWRVKGDRQASASMLLDGRFLRAFIIPVLLHETWDLTLSFPNINPYVMDGLQAAVAIVGWYVVFTMIQQGLHQVRDMQKAQLQSTLRTVQATLGLGAMRRPMQPPPPGYAVQR